MRQRFPQIVGPPKDDICYATQNRQEAVRWLAAESQLCLVLGSQNSSNSQRLREIAQECGVSAQLIDGREDLQDEWFTDVDCVLVTAGASAPETVLEQCLDYLREKFDAQVEVRSLREEEVHFPLPRELRQYSS